MEHGDKNQATKQQNDAYNASHKEYIKSVKVARVALQNKDR